MKKTKKTIDSLDTRNARKAIQALYGPDAYAKRAKSGPYSAGSRLLILTVPTGEILLGAGGSYEEALEMAKNDLRPEAAAARVKALEAQVAEMNHFITQLKEEREKAAEEAQYVRSHMACSVCGSKFGHTYGCMYGD